MSHFLEGDNAVKAGSAIYTFINGFIYNDKRKSDLPIDENLGEAKNKRARVNPSE